MLKKMAESRLFYVHDPMCSWCYAFSKSLAGLQQNLPADINMIYVLGGLAPDNDETMPIGLQRSIQQTWRRIENTVPGIRFNYDFWSLNRPMRSTYPACRAILTARMQGAEFESKLIRAIQNAYYQKAKNPSMNRTLYECAVEVGLDKVKFVNDLNSPDTEKLLYDEIQLARAIGVSSYPSLRLLHNEKLTAIAVDYVNYQPMLAQITQRIID